MAQHRFANMLGGIALVAAVGGCALGSTASHTPASASPTPPPMPAIRTADVGDAGDVGDAWLAVRPGDTDEVRVIRASTGELFVSLPVGVPATPEWTRFAAATAHDGSTVVQDLATYPEPGGPSVTIAGEWRLPTIGYDPQPVGLSADGSTLALVPAGALPDTGTGSVRSRFAVLGFVPLSRTPRIIDLPGTFDFDALSPDGQTLYLVEHLEGVAGRYQVRAVDVASGRLRDGVIADKRTPDEPMAGWPISQLRTLSGLVLTLYRGLEHPFIHALQSVDGWAVCIDLPAVGAEDEAAAMDWGLALAPDRAIAYAVNSTVGIIAEVNLDDLVVGRTAMLPAAEARSGRATLVKLGHEPGGPIGRRVVVSPDGSSVYAAGRDGIAAIATGDLSRTGAWLSGQAVTALALSHDGASLYALLAADGRIVRVDPRNGDVVGGVPGSGFETMFGVFAG